MRRGNHYFLFSEWLKRRERNYQIQHSKGGLSVQTKLCIFLHVFLALEIKAITKWDSPLLFSLSFIKNNHLQKKDDSLNQQKQHWCLNNQSYLWIGKGIILLNPEALWVSWIETAKSKWMHSLTSKFSVVKYRRHSDE